MSDVEEFKRRNRDLAWLGEIANATMSNGISEGNERLFRGVSDEALEVAGQETRGVERALVTRIEDIDVEMPFAYQVSSALSDALLGEL